MRSYKPPDGGSEKPDESRHPDRWESINPSLRALASDVLRDEEELRDWLEIDLDETLRYRSGLLLVTDQRLLFIEMPPLPGSHWSISQNMSLQYKDRLSTGSLELAEDGQTRQVWRFTAAKRVKARGFKACFEHIQQGNFDDDEPLEIFAALCTSCGAPLGPEQALCPQCEAAKSKQAFRSLSRLLSFAKPRATAIIIGLTLQLLGTAASLIPPYLTIPMIDDVLIPYQNGAPVSFNIIWYYLAGLFGAQVVSWLLTWGRTWILAWASERVAADLRIKTYAHLQKLSIEYFGGKRTGDLISRVGIDTDRICYFLSVHLLDFMSDVLMILMTAATLLWIDPMLALFTLIPLPFISYLVHRVRSRLVEGFTRGSMAWSELTNLLADTIPGIRVVKAFAQEKREVERFKHTNDLVLEANDKVNALWSFFSSVVMFLTGVGVLIVWGAGAWLVFHSGVKVGVLSGFVQYISRFYGRLDSMSRMVSAFQRAGVSAQRVFAVLDRVPSVPEPASPVHPGRLKGEIEFREVSFHYGTGHPVLRNLDFRIEPGEMIGLIGPSGSGKSTLTNLICRFYDVKEGSVCVDGADIRSYPIEEYRRNIGIVLQEPFLFYGTIAENIAYGKPGAAKSEIIAAARAARAHEFILKLPDGYDSIVGERGQFLSGGERQRISIARAILIDPRILILDEATSSVDNETEREIQAALENLIRGRTTVAIAHRLSTLRKANRLLVIEHGRISRITTPAEILPPPDASEAEPENGSGKGVDTQTFDILITDSDDLIIVDGNGVKIEGVEPARAFPLSARNEKISLLDRGGCEVFCIEDLDLIGSSLRDILEHSLARKEFVPVIQKITEAQTESTPSEWHVITDRGATAFFLNNEEDMRRLGEKGAIFVDTHGIRYIIPDLKSLDAKSRRILNKFF